MSQAMDQPFDRAKFPFEKARTQIEQMLMIATRSLTYDQLDNFRLDEPRKIEVWSGSGTVCAYFENVIALFNPETMDLEQLLVSNLKRNGTKLGEDTQRTFAEDYYRKLKDNDLPYTLRAKRYDQHSTEWLVEATYRGYPLFNELGSLRLCDYSGWLLNPRRIDAPRFGPVPPRIADPGAVARMLIQAPDIPYRWFTAYPLKLAWYSVNLAPEEYAKASHTLRQNSLDKARSLVYSMGVSDDEAPVAGGFSVRSGSFMVDPETGVRFRCHYEDIEHAVGGSISPGKPFDWAQLEAPLSAEAKGKTIRLEKGGFKSAEAPKAPPKTVPVLIRSGQRHLKLAYAPKERLFVLEGGKAPLYARAEPEFADRLTQALK